jgi:hypothetical protein
MSWLKYFCIGYCKILQSESGKGCWTFPTLYSHASHRQILENFPQGISAISMHETCYYFIMFTTFDYAYDIRKIA